MTEHRATYAVNETDAVQRQQICDLLQEAEDKLVEARHLAAWPNDCRECIQTAMRASALAWSLVAGYELIDITITAENKDAVISIAPRKENVKACPK